ncbi:chondroitinase B-like protein [Herbihabitans rhizosphaerae]|uniref:Chondroitinase B-like protein n=1 Tax=Herbihabitans rhizosphaerae TaxID=1872711 RepID=A0A4V2EU68_9PSEU|nr:chondroitinase-B domain-containing protein [Herbihabitans rhizosphaerae]RZS43523.1 chondroitinase B-like protein [Herbihabitans rhizosphaerae]
MIKKGAAVIAVAVALGCAACSSETAGGGSPFGVAADRAPAAGLPPVPTPPAPVGPATRTVRTAAELAAAGREARPGDVIQLADGVYPGKFQLTSAGTADKPITLRGGRGAVIDGEGIKEGRTVELTASHWRLEGFTVRNGQKGIMGIGVTGTQVIGLEVHQIGDEAVHFQHGSTDNVVRDSFIHDTGKRRPGFGEGVYFGSAKSNWPGGQPDRSDRNKAYSNRIGPNVTGEGVDIKEGTTGGEVRGNTFDGAGQTGENSGESWINAKGNDYVIAENTGAGAHRSGFKTRTEAEGFGCGNTFRANSGSVAPFAKDDGYAFDITNNRQCGDRENVVCDDNRVGPGGKGLSTIEPRPCRP